MVDEVAQGTGGDENPETEKERNEVQTILKAYNAARQFDQDARRDYARDRKYAAGKADQTWAVDANVIGTFIDILVSFIYAKDPDISVQPGEQVGDQPDDDANDFAQTLKLVIRRLWKDGKLKKRARKQLRSTLSVGPGWLKIIMTKEMRNDPLVEKDLNDAQDNMLRLEAKRKQIEEDGHTDDELDALMKEKEMLITSLENRLEVVFRRGLAIDFVRAEDMQVSLDVAEIADHLDGNWNGNQMFIQKDELMTMFPRLTQEDVDSATVFFQRQDQKDHHLRTIEDTTFKDAERFTTTAPSTTSNGTSEDVSFGRVVEVWDKRDNHIKTIIDGIDKWARVPYQPPYATSRFYPYFQLALFPVDGERHPQSLSMRLKKLQDEYAGTRSSGRLARQRSIPGVIFDNGQISPDDAAKIEQSVEQEYIGVQSISGDDVRKAFAEKPVGRYDPRIYDTNPVLRDMERISGVQEALSSTIQTEKTATEAGIQQQGFQSRTNADRDELEEMLDDIAQYTGELSVQALPVDYVQRIAGKLAFWPEGMAFEDVVTMVEMEIVAGSTGAPNKQAEQQAWTTLLPLIRETMVVIQQAFAQGNEPLAEALMELLQETAKRIDDRVNLKRFIPQLAQTPEGAIPAGSADGATVAEATAGAPAPAPLVA